MKALYPQTTGERERSPNTKNCAPQATAICGSGERQPPLVQWMASARRGLLCDQGIPNARGGPVVKVTDSRFWRIMSSCLVSLKTFREGGAMHVKSVERLNVLPLV
ncbi:hypothetical protein TNCV_1230441 [Trichonephila clavipes]|nr:hypothetical protein TNCV_1230441 [Trichonephila clavipes]